MKTLIVAIIVLLSCSLGLKAQTTNTLNGADTNSAPTKLGVGAVISFRTVIANKWITITNATVTNVGRDELTWKAHRPTGSLFGGRVKFTELALEQAMQFGYDPEKAEALKQAQQDAYAARLRAQALKAKEVPINGKVLQVTDDGLLVIPINYIAGRSPYEPVLITGAQERARILRKEYVDGSPIYGLAYRNGTYSYTTTSGATKTILKLTVDVNEVFP